MVRNRDPFHRMTLVDPLPVELVYPISNSDGSGPGPSKSCTLSANAPTPPQPAAATGGTLVFCIH